LALARGFAAQMAAFMKKTGSPPQSARASTSASASVSLDALDLAILERYQEDTQQAAHAIGRAVGLSAAAVQRRLKRLRASRVIEAEVAIVSPAAMGMTLSCIVMVDLDREDARTLAAFQKRICEYPEVQQCYYVAGREDFVLVILAADMASYEAFTRRALLADDNVKSFTTHVAMSRAKVSLGVPLTFARRRLGAQSKSE
jgi:Lrp/AsnC family transcriptional regulator, leucine-responsive regulatory protein